MRSILFFLTTTIILMCVSSIYVAGQRHLSLETAILIAQEQSFEYKVAVNRYQSSIWQYRNYQATFLPSLYIDGTIPNYSRTISRITLPNGEDTFVGQNQAFSSLRLGIRQHIGLTGGLLSMNTLLNRIDVFDNSRQVSYAATPLSISYSQHTIGYNSLRWLKRTEPLRFESANRKFVADMQRIATQTVTFFFNLLSAVEKVDLSEQNLASADTLHRIAKDRFNLGKLPHSDLLQLHLNSLNARMQLTRDSVDAVLAAQELRRYLLLPDRDVELILPSRMPFYQLSFDEVLSHAQQNSQEVIDFRLQRLEAEQNLARSKAENGLRFNLEANFGMTSTSSKLNSVLREVENQQQIAVGFSVPIIDWGYARTQRQQAEANLTMVESQAEQQQLQLEQEVMLYTARWNLHISQLALAQETQHVAAQNYELEVERFLRGTVSINDLNSARAQKDNAANAYIDALRTYWELYYTIRRLTLFDFELSMPINVKNNINTLFHDN